MKRDGCCPGYLDNAWESGGSSESHKSVVVVGEEEYMSYGPRLPKGGWLVHNQVLRIKDEEFRMGEEDNNMVAMMNHHGANNIFMVLMARQVLPCSPLGGRAVTATTAL